VKVCQEVDVGAHVPELGEVELSVDLELFEFQFLREEELAVGFVREFLADFGIIGKLLQQFLRSFNPRGLELVAVANGHVLHLDFFNEFGEQGEQQFLELHDPLLLPRLQYVHSVFQVFLEILRLLH